MAEAYPPGLRGPLTASKSRTQPAAFSMADPRRGYGYAQASGTDVPVFWDVQFRFTVNEAQQFILWFTVVLQRGLLEFVLPIKTEFGVVDHTCRFTTDGLLPARENGALREYSAKIMARAIVIPAEYLEAAELIAGTPAGYGEWLDMAMSSAMPES